MRAGNDRLGLVKLLAVGDPPVSQVAGWFSVGACDYTEWVGPGLSLVEAADYVKASY